MNLLKTLVNPVISMELRLRMRSKKTPWIISLYLIALGVIVFLYILLEANNRGYFNPNSSRDMFIILSFIQFALISLVTPGLTAGVISSEREKQTLNILLTTGLTPAKIILGKWLSSLSFMLLVIFSTMPVYSIVFLYGGISPRELMAVFGLYLIGMLAIGSFGVLFSTLFKRTGVATVVTYTTIIVYTAITAFLPGIISSFYYMYNQGTARVTVPNWPDYFYSINPITAMLNIFEQNITNIRNMPIDPYWVFIIFFSVITILALLSAIYFIKPVRKLRSKK